MLSSKAMASDEGIAKRMDEILEGADLSVITTKDVRQQLEREMGDVSMKKGFIRQRIEEFIMRHVQTAGVKEEEEEEQEDVEEEEEEAGDQEEGVKAEVDENEEDLDDDGDAEKPEEDSKRLRAKIKRAIKESLPKKPNAKRRTAATGFQKVCQLSPQLEAIVGEPQLPRTQVVKVLWQYIRDRKLQLRKDRRKIVCDEPLKKLFNVDQIDMFIMQRKLTKHIIPLDEVQYLNAPAREKERSPKEEKDYVQISGSRRERVLKRQRRQIEDDKEETELQKRVQNRRTGFAAPVRISSELKEFLGVYDNKMTRQSVTKLIWEYIKSNKLQDSSDKRIVLCDDKLQKLFDCEKFSGFGGMPKLLKGHFSKEEVEEPPLKTEDIEEPPLKTEDIEEPPLKTEDIEEEVPSPDVKEELQPIKLENENFEETSKSAEVQIK